MAWIATCRFIAIMPGRPKVIAATQYVIMKKLMKHVELQTEATADFVRELRGKHVGLVLKPEMFVLGLPRRYCKKDVLELVKKGYLKRKDVPFHNRK